MPLTVEPLTPGFAARITGIDLDRDLSDAAVDEVVAALDEYAVGVFPGQKLTDDQHLAFAGRLGPLETTRKTLRPGYKHRLDTRLSDISNLTLDGKVRPKDDHWRLNDFGNRLWHSDSSFKKTPAKYSMLRALVVPSWGGQTQFADMRAAYDALPERKKRQLDGLVALHAVMYSREKVGFVEFMQEERDRQPPVPQTLVRTHPGSGRKGLYLSAHIGEIEGMTIPEGRMMLLDLIEHATQPEFVYTHDWQVDDLVIWDNRCTMHRGREHDLSEVRDLRRATVGDVAPTLEQAQVA